MASDLSIIKKLINIDTQMDSRLVNLPQDLLIYNILGLLNFPTVVSVMLSCKKLKIIADSPLLFQKLLHRDFKQKSDSVSPELACQTYRDSYTIHQNIMKGRYEMLYLSELFKESGNIIRCLKVYKDKLIAGADEGCKVWDVNTGKCLIDFKEHKQWNIFAIEIVDDKVFTASSDHTCKKWALETGTVEVSFGGHADTVNCLKVYKDKLITGSSDKTCRIWDKNTGKCLQVLGGHPDPISSLDVADDIIIAASYEVGTCKKYMIKAWDFSGNCLYTLTGKGSIRVKIKDGKFFAVGGTYSPICQMIELKTGQILKSLHHNIGSANCLEFFEDSVIIGKYGEYKIWDPIKNTVLAISEHQTHINTIKVFDRKLFLGFNKAMCTVWDLDTRNCLGFFAEHNFGTFDHISCVDYSNGKLISASWDGSVIIRNFKLDPTVKKDDPSEIVKELLIALKNKLYTTLPDLILRFRKIPWDIKKEILTYCNIELWPEEDDDSYPFYTENETIFALQTKLHETNKIICSLNRDTANDNIICLALEKFLNDSKPLQSVKTESK
jgi:WD40 repeat protein